MTAATFPFRMLLLTVSGWVNRHQQDVIAYVVEENRVLKEQLRGRKLRLNDGQRRRLAAKANCNAYAERFVLSIKSECLNRMVFFGEASLRRAIAAYLQHYHQERPHQGLGNETLEPSPRPTVGEVRCTERLGGLLKHYTRAA